jgi:DNA processing protein
MSTHNMQINQIHLSDPEYPLYLSEIPSPPKTLYFRGKLPMAPCVAIVGTRNPTRYGEQVTYQLAYELAQAGLAIVSGLAIGIDSIAHRAALDAGGVTVAVQGTGLDRISPARHRQLGHDIINSGGAIVSEYEVDDRVFPSNFAIRNRITSGLCMGVLVIESNAHGGSLITSDFAVKQDRLVFAVPGNITQPRSAGPNNLIRKGAIPVTGSIDVLQALNFESSFVPEIPVTPSNGQEARILKLLREGETTSQFLIESTGLPAGEFANIISLMEITGRVRNLGSGHWGLQKAIQQEHK